jgi:hypothetical protein
MFFAEPVLRLPAVLILFILSKNTISFLPFTDPRLLGWGGQDHAFCPYGVPISGGDGI